MIRNIIAIIVMAGLFGCASFGNKEKFIDMTFDKTKYVAVEEIFELTENHYYVTIKRPDGKLRSYYVNIIFTIRWYRGSYVPEPQVLIIDLIERQIDNKRR